MEKPKMNDIKVKRPVLNKPKTESFANVEPVKPAPVLNKAPVVNVKQNITEPIVNSIKNNDADYFLKKTKKRKFGFIFFVVILILSLISYLIFIISNVFLTITPNIKERSLNKNVTLTSWVAPVESTVIFVNEDMDKDAAVNVSSPEESNKFLNQKISSRFKYDTPKDYIIVDGCKTSVKYEEYTVDENSNKKVKVKGSQAALAVKESSLKKFITNELNLQNEEIKDISKLKCVLDSNITDYSIGSKVNGLSFNINGSIKTEYVINTDYIKLMTAGYSKKKAILNLNGEDRILSYKIRIRPFNFMPILPKNKSHYDIKIQSVL